MGVFNFLGGEFVFSDDMAISKYKGIKFEMIGDIAVLEMDGETCGKVGCLIKSSSKYIENVMLKLIELCEG